MIEVSHDTSGSASMLAEARGGSGRDGVAHSVARDGDVYVTKLTADGAALVYATYLGGGSYDQARGVATMPRAPLTGRRDILHGFPDPAFFRMAS